MEACHDRAVPDRPHPRRSVLLDRRTVLGLGLGAVTATGLAGCGIRLEDDAPRVPGIPTRRPVPGEAFLIALWRHSTDLADRATALGGAPTTLPHRLARLHTEQGTVLRAELVRLGVPASVLDGADEPTATSTATGNASAATSRSPGTSTGTTSGPAALAAEEASDLGPTAVASLARLDAATVPLVGSVLAQRAAAAALLGHPATWPEQTVSDSSLVAADLSSTRAAVYAFEVVTAQSAAGAQRTLATSTLTILRSRASVQESMAGTAAGPPALAYPLPFAVTTSGAARKLAVQVLTSLREAVARDLGTAGTDTAVLGLLVQWLGDTEVLASRWGVALAPFPGLR